VSAKTRRSLYVSSEMIFAWRPAIDAVKLADVE
jgi:hypothetical protein